MTLEHGKGYIMLPVTAFWVGDWQLEHVQLS